MSAVLLREQLVPLREQLHSRLRTPTMLSSSGTATATTYTGDRIIFTHVVLRRCRVSAIRSTTVSSATASGPITTSSESASGFAVAEEDGRSETVQELPSENDEDIDPRGGERRCTASCRDSCSACANPQSSRRVFEDKSMSGIEIIPPTFKLRGRLGALTGSA